MICGLVVLFIGEGDQAYGIIPFMSAVHPPLSENTIERIRSGWATKVKVSPNVLSHLGKTVVPRDGFLSVVALQLQESVVVICPPALEPLLSRLSGIELLDMSTLLRVLAMFSPDPVGTATIAYADSNTLVSGAGVGVAHLASSKEVMEVMSGCTQDEQDESGLAQMPVQYALQSSDGSTTALSGYEAWNNDIAQLGVLTAPQKRGQGFGFTVAMAAASAAMDADLIPQWRSRIDNDPSQRLGHRLGFVHLGHQLALAVTLS